MDKKKKLSRDKRTQFYLTMLEVYGVFRDRMPGGPDAAAVGMVVALGSLSESPVNVSTIADTLGFSRRTVRRHLDLLITEGYVSREDDGEEGWPTYNSHHLSEKVIENTEYMCDRVYKVFCNRMGPLCDQSDEVRDVLRQQASKKIIYDKDDSDPGS